MAIAWLLAGGATAFLSGLSIRWTVLRLRPESLSRAMAWVLGGAALRLGLAALLLVAAIRQGIVAGLLAFLGLWIGRWAAVWYLSRSQKPLGASGI